MAESRTPGPVCRTRGTPKVDLGTMVRKASPHPKAIGHRTSSTITTHLGLQVRIRDLQKDVRPRLYHVAYARSASETDYSNPDISAALAEQDRRATEYAKEYVEAYLRAYMSSNAAGEAYLEHMLKAKEMFLQQWRDNVTAAQHASAAHEEILKVVVAGLQTLKSAGMISATILGVVAPGWGSSLDWGFTGVEIANDVQNRGNSSVMLVISKDIGKVAAQKGSERAAGKAAEKASGHLAEYVEAKASEIWLEAVSKTPWAVSRPTEELLTSFRSAQVIRKFGAKSVGVAFAAPGLYKQLKENYEAWKAVF